MTAEDLIVRLDGVRATGTDRWIARCRAHDDRHPSLSVYEPGDGHILIPGRLAWLASPVVGGGPARRLRHKALLLTLFIERVQRAEDYLLEDLDRAVLARYNSMTAGVPIPTF